jgi:hypothetical protein
MASNHSVKLAVKPQNKTTISKPVICWAHTRSGRRCSTLVLSREGEPIPVPYCDRHLKNGDGALRIVSHPKVGKCLVARYNLPARYRIAFHGIRGKCSTSDKEDRSLSFYPPDPVSGSNFQAESGLRKRKINNYNGVVNPKDTGDVMQFAACPGPSERQNLRSTFQYFGKRHGRLAALEFLTTEPVSRNAQLCFWYGSGWWSARHVKRCDVGTESHPAPKRKQRKTKIAHQN